MYLLRASPSNSRAHPLANHRQRSPDARAAPLSQSWSFGRCAPSLPRPICGAPSRARGTISWLLLVSTGNQSLTSPTRISRAWMGKVRARGSSWPILRVPAPAWPSLRLTLPGDASRREQRLQLPSGGARRSLKGVGRTALEPAVIGRWEWGGDKAVSLRDDWLG